MGWHIGEGYIHRDRHRIFVDRERKNRKLLQ